MISTRLTERFGIRHPIVYAPMALVTGGALAAAVSRAGGLGIVGGAYAGTVGGEPDLETELALAKSVPAAILRVVYAGEFGVISLPVIGVIRGAHPAGKQAVTPVSAIRKLSRGRHVGSLDQLPK